MALDRVPGSNPALRRRYRCSLGAAAAGRPQITLTASLADKNQKIRAANSATRHRAPSAPSPGRTDAFSRPMDASAGPRRAPAAACGRPASLSEAGPAPPFGGRTVFGKPNGRFVAGAEQARGEKRRPNPAFSGLLPWSEWSRRRAASRPLDAAYFFPAVLGRQTEQASAAVSAGRSPGQLAHSRPSEIIPTGPADVEAPPPPPSPLAAVGR